MVHRVSLQTTNGECLAVDSRALTARAIVKAIQVRQLFVEWARIVIFVQVYDCWHCAPLLTIISITCWRFYFLYSFCNGLPYRCPRTSCLSIYPFSSIHSVPCVQLWVSSFSTCIHVPADACLQFASRCTNLLVHICYSPICILLLIKCTPLYTFKSRAN